MNVDTHRAALRAAHALVAAGVAAVACSPAAPAPSSAATAPVDCRAVVDAAFPGTEDRYTSEHRAAPPAVEKCCADAVTQSGPNASEIFARHRWDCCSAIDLAQVKDAACTPWGPPVPPPLARRMRVVARQSRTRSLTA